MTRLLKFYPNREAAFQLSIWFAQGFRLHYTRPSTFLSTKNLRSAVQFEQETLNKLNTEISLGRIFGPFSTLPISTLRISPIGVIPKSDGGWRLMTDLSSPLGNSVNFYISPHLA